MLRFISSLPFRLNAGLILIYLVSSSIVYYFFHLGMQKYLYFRMDEYLETEVLSITSELDFSSLPGNIEEVENTLQRFGYAHGALGSFLVLISPNRSVLASSNLRFFDGFDFKSIPFEEISRAPFIWQTVKLADQQFRVIYYQMPEGYILQIGFSLNETGEILHNIQTQFGIALFSILLLGGLAGWFYCQFALRGLGYLRDRAMTIRSKGDLDQRVETKTGSLETDDLAKTFNEMLERIQDLMKNLTYVMDNIAHDIRTPVTRMRGYAEMKLGNRLITEAESEMAGQVIEECDQILNLVNILLEITAADSGLFQPRNIDQNAAEVLREGCDLFEPVWDSKKLQVTIDCPSDLLWHGDTRVLQRVVSNMLDNAIKYSPAGEHIHLSLVPFENGILLKIKDNGPGIEIHEQELVFNRFYRCKTARSQPGNGLGLSFCKSIVEAVGGSITLFSKPGQGTEFEIYLP